MPLVQLNTFMLDSDHYASVESDVDGPATFRGFDVDSEHDIEDTASQGGTYSAQIIVEDGYEIPIVHTASHTTERKSFMEPPQAIVRALPYLDYDAGSNAVLPRQAVKVPPPRRVPRGVYIFLALVAVVAVAGLAVAVGQNSSTSTDTSDSDLDASVAEAGTNGLHDIDFENDSRIATFIEGIINTRLDYQQTVMMDMQMTIDQQAREILVLLNNNSQLEDAISDLTRKAVVHDAALEDLNTSVALLADVVDVIHAGVQGIERSVVNMTANVATLTYSASERAAALAYTDTLSSVTVNGQGSAEVFLLESNAMNGVTAITGDLYVQDTGVSNISGLNKLSTVGGHAKVLDNAALINISGLKMLTSVRGNLQIFNNSVLTRVDGFNLLTSVSGSIRIYNNANLTNINGFNLLPRVRGWLRTENNNALTSISGYKLLTSVGGNLDIRSNAVLTNISGLHLLTNVSGFLNIHDNPLLTTTVIDQGLASLQCHNGTHRLFTNCPQRILRLPPC